MDEKEKENEKSKKGRGPVPSTFQKRALWRAITGISLTTIALLAVGLILVLGNVLGFLQPVLVPLALAGILAYLLDPVVRWTRSKRFFNRDLSRLQAIGVVFFLAVSAVVFLGISVFLPATRQLGQIFDQRAEIISSINSWAISVERQFGIGKKTSPADTKHEATIDKAAAPPAADQATTDNGDATAPPEEDKTGGNSGTNEATSHTWAEFIKWLRSPETGQAALEYVSTAASGFFGAVGYIVGLFLVPVYLFFFLKDSSGIRQGWANYVPLRNSWLKDEVVSVVSEVNGYLIAYFRGQVLVSIIDGVATGVILMLMGLDYAVVIGLGLAVLGVIPFVGFILTAVPAVLIAAAQTHDSANPVMFPLAVALVFVAVQQVDGIFIQPKIVGKTVGLHPLTVIFSVLFWSLLIGGILGALLAVPLTAAVKVLFRRYIWEQKIRPNVLEDSSPAPPPKPA